MSLPKLRFREFSNRKLETKNLGEITKWSSGGTPAKDNPEFWNGDIPWISASTMHGAHYEDSDLKITKSGLQSGSRLANKNDILLLVRGSILFKRIPVGLAMRDIAFNQDVKSIKIIDGIKSQFVLYWFQASENKILNMVVGTGIGAGKLETSILQAIELGIPEKDEQTKIANFLMAVDEKIAQLTRKYELLARYKKGVMQQLFSQEMRFKDEGDRDFPEWEVYKLIDVASINPKSTKLPDNFIYIDLESVKDGYLLFENRVELKTAPSRAQRLLQKNDILYQTVRPYQKNNLLFDKDGDYVASTGYAQIRTNQNTNFIFQLLYSDDFVNDVLSRCTGTSYPAIDSTSLSEIQINIPNIKEQTKIAIFLTAIDEKITQTQTYLETVKRYKQGLLQQMFI